MPGLSPQQSSFIPRRNSGMIKRQPRQNTFFVLGIISYACLVAAPTASAAVYAYQMYATKQFEASVNALNTEINKFNEADMSRVLEYNQRLALIKQIVNNHISLNRALEVLEANTAESVTFNSLIMNRTGANTLLVKSELLTDSIDAALFQRKTYTDVKALASSSLENIKFTAGKKDGSGRTVAFSGKFNFNASDISFIPDGQPASSSPVTITEAVASSTVSSSTSKTTTP
jgi:hypothetical protein